MSQTNNADFQIGNVFDVKGKVASVRGWKRHRTHICSSPCRQRSQGVHRRPERGKATERCRNTRRRNRRRNHTHHRRRLVQTRHQKPSPSDRTREKCLCILINNAGISSTTQTTENKTAEDMSKNLFDDPNATMDDKTTTYRTNVAQCFFATTAFLPFLQEATALYHDYSGPVTNISSISGLVQSAQHHFSYNASKAATIHLTKLLASKVAANDLKVRINSIAPGVFPSEMTADASDAAQKSVIPKEKFEENVSARWPGRDQDMAGAVLFAVTNQYLNGQIIVVDGGYLLSVRT